MEVQRHDQKAQDGVRRQTRRGAYEEVKRSNGSYLLGRRRSIRPAPGVQHQPPVLAVEFHLPPAPILAPGLQLHQQRKWVGSLLHDDDDKTATVAVAA